MFSIQDVITFPIEIYTFGIEANLDVSEFKTFFIECVHDKKDFPLTEFRELFSFLRDTKNMFAHIISSDFTEDTIKEYAKQDVRVEKVLPSILKLFNLRYALWEDVSVTLEYTRDKLKDTLRLMPDVEDSYSELEENIFLQWKFPPSTFKLKLQSILHSKEKIAINNQFIRPIFEEAINSICDHHQCYCNLINDSYSYLLKDLGIIDTFNLLFERTKQLMVRC